jgi:hypothetical protein
LFDGCGGFLDGIRIGNIEGKYQGIPARGFDFALGGFESIDPRAIKLTLAPCPPNSRGVARPRPGRCSRNHNHFILQFTAVRSDSAPPMHV